MATSLEALETEVLRLSPEDRSHLLDRLIATLDGERALDEAWDREAARRDAEIERGDAQTVNGDQVVKRLRAQIG